LCVTAMILMSSHHSPQFKYIIFHIFICKSILVYVSAYFIYMWWHTWVYFLILILHTCTCRLLMNQESRQHYHTRWVQRFFVSSCCVQIKFNYFCLSEHYIMSWWLVKLCINY